jgi:dihydrofolate reductase
MLALIAAVAQNNCIGAKNQLPWYIPEDLKHFKKITDGHAVLMGRNTWLSLPEKFRPLPNRRNIVLSYNPVEGLPAGVLWYNNLDEALQKHAGEDVYVMGGGMMYAQTIERADTLYITEVHKTVDGDVFFPEINKNIWREVEREDHGEYSFVVYKKNS